MAVATVPQLATVSARIRKEIDPLVRAISTIRQRFDAAIAAAAAATGVSAGGGDHAAATTSQLEQAAAAAAAASLAKVLDRVTAIEATYGRLLAHLRTVQADALDTDLNALLLTQAHVAEGRIVLPPAAQQQQDSAAGTISTRTGTGFLPPSSFLLSLPLVPSARAAPGGHQWSSPKAAPAAAHEAFGFLFNRQDCSGSYAVTSLVQAFYPSSVSNNSISNGAVDGMGHTTLPPSAAASCGVATRHHSHHHGNHHMEDDWWRGVLYPSLADPTDLTIEDTRRAREGLALLMMVARDVTEYLLASGRPATAVEYVTDLHRLLYGHPSQEEGPGAEEKRARAVRRYLTQFYDPTTGGGPAAAAEDAFSAMLTAATPGQTPAKAPKSAPATSPALSAAGGPHNESFSGTRSLSRDQHTPMKRPQHGSFLGSSSSQLTPQKQASFAIEGSTPLIRGGSSGLWADLAGEGGDGGDAAPDDQLTYFTEELISALKTFAALTKELDERLRCARGEASRCPGPVCTHAPCRQFADLEDVLLDTPFALVDAAHDVLVLAASVAVRSEELAASRHGDDVAEMALCGILDLFTADEGPTGPQDFVSDALPSTVGHLVTELVAAIDDDEGVDASDRALDTDSPAGRAYMLVARARQWHHRTRMRFAVHAATAFNECSVDQVLTCGACVRLLEGSAATIVRPAQRLLTGILGGHEEGCASSGGLCGPPVPRLVSRLALASLAQYDALVQYMTAPPVDAKKPFAASPLRGAGMPSGSGTATTTTARTMGSQESDSGQHSQVPSPDHESSPATLWPPLVPSLTQYRVQALMPRPHTSWASEGAALGHAAAPVEVSPHAEGGSSLSANHRKALTAAPLDAFLRVGFADQLAALVAAGLANFTKESMGGIEARQFADRSAGAAAAALDRFETSVLHVRQPSHVPCPFTGLPLIQRGATGFTETSEATAHHEDEEHVDGHHHSHHHAHDAHHGHHDAFEALRPRCRPYATVPLEEVLEAQRVLSAFRSTAASSSDSENHCPTAAPSPLDSTKLVFAADPLRACEPVCLPNGVLFAKALLPHIVTTEREENAFRKWVAGGKDPSAFDAAVAFQGVYDEIHMDSLSSTIPFVRCPRTGQRYRTSDIRKVFFL